MKFFYLLSTFLAVIAQLSDCITTYMVLSQGGYEANPLMVWLVAHPMIGVPLKGIVPIIIALICYKRYYPDKKGTAPMLLCAVFGFGAAAWNLFVYYNTKG